MRLPWACHNQSQDTNWRHCVTGPELPYFHKRKCVLDQSVKMPWHRLSMGVAGSIGSWPSLKVVECFRNGSVQKIYQRTFMSQLNENHSILMALPNTNLTENLRNQSILMRDRKPWKYQYEVCNVWETRIKTEGQGNCQRKYSFKFTPAL